MMYLHIFVHRKKKNYIYKYVVYCTLCCIYSVNPSEDHLAVRYFEELSSFEEASSWQF